MTPNSENITDLQVGFWLVLILTVFLGSFATGIAYEWWAFFALLALLGAGIAGRLWWGLKKAKKAAAVAEVKN